MITSQAIVQLGIKGQDAVLSTLKKVEAEKSKFSRPAAAQLMARAARAQHKQSVAKAAEGFQKQGFSKGESLRLVNLQRQQKDATEKNTTAQKKSNEMMQKGVGAAMSVGGGLSTLDPASAFKGAASGVGSLFGPAGMAVGSGLGFITDALGNFTSGVKQAAGVVAAYQESVSTQARFTGRNNFLQTQRSDIDPSTVRVITEGLGDKFGRLSTKFQSSVERLFGSNGSATDLKQATQLAQGQFSALGTDEGFFLEQIANSVGNMPPTIKQAIIGSLQDSIPKAALAVDAAAGARGVQTQFGYNDLAKAAGKVQNAGAALDVDALATKIDLAFSKAIGNLITAIKFYIGDPLAFIKDALSAMLNVVPLFAGIKHLIGRFGSKDK